MKTDAELIHLLASRLRDADSERDNCPGAEALATLALKAAPPTQGRQWLDHAASCPQCATELKAALAIATEFDSRGNPATASRFRRVPHSWPVALAACLVAVIGLGWYLARPVSQHVVRDGAAVTQGEQTPVSGTRLQESPQQFSWPTIKGPIEEIQFVIFDARMSPVLSIPLVRADGIDLDADQSLPMGHTYFWSLQRDGQNLIEPTWFELRK